MKIHLIWAQDINGGIGIKNSLPWHISEDLKNFKKLTINSPIIMGRKTWESLPFKPLPERRNIVLSSRLIKDVECYKSIDDCINNLKIDEDVYIIGGAQIYKLFYEYAYHLHITIVDLETIGIDTYFPIELSDIKNSFKLVESVMLNENANYYQWIRKNKV